MNRKATERQEKIRILSRKNRGKAEIPSFLEALSNALGQGISADALIDLQETEALSCCLRTRYTSSVSDNTGFRKLFRREDRSVLFWILTCLGKELADENVYFLMKQSETCGAVLVDGLILLSRAEAALLLDRDSVSVISQNQVEGLLLDFNPDELEYVYELTVWGDRWPFFIRDCVRANSGQTNP